jgi:hypothetical protein
MASQKTPNWISPEVTLANFLCFAVACTKVVVIVFPQKCASVLHTGMETRLPSVRALTQNCFLWEFYARFMWLGQQAGALVEAGAPERHQLAGDAVWPAL